MSKKKIQKGICSICGNEGELTKEHIPPKGVFLKPRPKNTITVVSCEKCNQDTKLDDEYFRFWVAAGAHSNSKLDELWKKKVIDSSFKRSPALLRKIQDEHKSLLKNHKKDPLKTYNGEVVLDELLSRCYPIDEERINRVVCKIVKGLYFHHLKKPLPNFISLTVSHDPIHWDVLEKIISLRKGMVGGEEGEFIYWFKFDDTEPFFSRWVLLFYLIKCIKIETKVRVA